MSVQAVISQLDEQIVALQARIDPKRPEGDLESFALIRALSLGRTFLRSLPENADYRAIDKLYKTQRVEVKSEGLIEHV